MRPAAPPNLTATPCFLRGRPALAGRPRADVIPGPLATPGCRRHPEFALERPVERRFRLVAGLFGDPGRAWTVDELGREVALSRSALAERFATLVGEPPIQYLMRWRLALAAQTLRSGGEAIVRVAERSGYESEAAFSRAFKREFGMPPAAWRRQGTGNPSGAGSSP